MNRNYLSGEFKMHDDFRAQVAGSAVLKERFGKIADYIIGAVAEKHGVQITADDVVNMPVARLSTYSASDDYVTGWQDEAVLAPSVAKAKERERLQEALAANGDSPEARGIAARLASMSGPERLAWARANNVAEPAKKQAQARGEGQSIEAKAALVERAAMLNGGAKIAFARKHGLS